MFTNILYSLVGNQTCTFLNNINYSASLPPLTSPSISCAANHVHHLATILSDLATILSHSTNIFSKITFLNFFTILIIRHYFNYLYFHTLDITPKDTTIPDPTVRILVSPLPHSVSHSPDMGCLRAQRIMSLRRLLV